MLMPKIQILLEQCYAAKCCHFHTMATAHKKIVKETKLAKNWRFGVAMPTAFNECLDTQAAAFATVVHTFTCHRKKQKRIEAAQTLDQLPPAD